MNCHVAVRNGHFQYADREILGGVDVEAQQGEFVALLGVNGAGKSTLLDLLTGLKKPTSGAVFLNGRELDKWSAQERARLISHLPQGLDRDLPFTVEQLVLMGRYPHADTWFESGNDERIAKEAMQQMHCWEFRHRSFTTLSGGERQRVLLAACIAQQTSVLLLDEPSTFLDIHQQLECFALLGEAARSGKLCIAVTHDVNLALAYCSRILLLREGRIAADMPVDEARSHVDWLEWLSPRLSLVATPDGRSWAVYR